ncbi:hypothetical protein V5H42_25895, partial [Salmonella enterica]
LSGSTPGVHHLNAAGLPSARFAPVQNPVVAMARRLRRLSGSTPGVHHLNAAGLPSARFAPVQNPVVAMAR